MTNKLWGKVVSLQHVSAIQLPDNNKVRDGILSARWYCGLNEH